MHPEGYGTSRILLASCGLPLVWYVLGQVRNVRERFNALKTHWPNAQGTSTDILWTVLTVLSVAFFLGAVYYWLSNQNVKKLKKREEEEFLAMVRKAGLTQGELKLLFAIGAGNKKVDKRRLITSPTRFDEAAGAYLRRYCAQKMNSAPVRKAVESIRIKLAPAFWQEARNDYDADLKVPDGSAPSGKPALAKPSVLKGLERIPILARLVVVNLASGTGEVVKSQVLENKGIRVRLLSLEQNVQDAWQPGDDLVFQVAVKEGVSFEVLMRFLVWESRKTGLFVAEAGSVGARGPDGGGDIIRVQQSVRIWHSGREEPAILDWINLEEAFIRDATPCPVGEMIDLETGLEDYGMQEKASGKVIYCSKTSQGKAEIGIGFLASPMLQYTPSMPLTPNMQKLVTRRRF